MIAVEKVDQASNKACKGEEKQRTIADHDRVSHTQAQGSCVPRSFSLRECAFLG